MNGFKLMAESYKKLLIETNDLENKEIKEKIKV